MYRDTFDKRWRNTRFYNPPGGIGEVAATSEYNRATINGFPDIPYVACSIQDDQESTEEWINRADKWYSENMGLVFVGTGVITYVRPEPMDFLDWSDAVEGSDYEY